MLFIDTFGKSHYPVQGMFCIMISIEHGTAGSMKLMIKICGITRIEDALFATELGASAVGFVFYPKSPRYIEPEAAGEISSALPGHIVRIGVFVDEDERTVLDIVKEAHLTAVQLHGNEDRGYIDRLGGLRVIKAVRIGPDFDEKTLADYSTGTFLVDAYSSTAHGGTGITVDWNVAHRLGRYGRIILAGGLNASNVREAVETARPWGVDVSSGVEVGPGVKDHDKLRAFFHALNGFV